MPRTLRAQLILASAAILVLMSGLLLWGAQSALRATLQEQFDQQLQVARPLLVAALSPLMAARDHAAVHEVVRQSVSTQGLAFLEVLDADARVVAGTPRPPGTRGMAATEAPLALEGQVYGLVRFGVHTEGLEAGLFKVTRNSVLIGALVLALGLVLMVGLTTWLTTHLRALAQASHRMARGEPVDHIPAGTGPSELRQLAQAFNQMTGALQERMQALGDSERRQRSLVDDLEGLNAELEDRVARRTAELEAARDAAEQANRAKSEFLSRMSHELRTPLNAILGFAQVLRARAHELPSLAAEPLRHIETAGWHLLQMINEVLDLARIESGRMSVSLESVDLAELLQQALQAIEPLARRKGVALQPGPTLPAPCWVRADRTRTRQVLDNLLSNAVKYNRPQGRVTARVQAAAQGRVAVSILDTGRGMDARQLERLFEPFTRFVAPGEGIEGTGIGLLITRRLLEAMGGRLDVQSQPGVGSCFRFELPAAQAPQAPAPAPGGEQAHAAAAAPAESPRTVVYVEDNPSNVEVFRQVLGLRPGLALLTAGDGVTGLALVRAHRPDLVVIDIDLPGMDGLELCRRLRADPQTAPIPRLALSANAMPRDIEQAREAGFEAYLTKPMDVPALIAQLDRLLPRPGAPEGSPA